MPASWQTEGSPSPLAVDLWIGRATHAALKVEAQVPLPVKSSRRLPFLRPTARKSRTGIGGGSSLRTLFANQSSAATLKQRLRVWHALSRLYSWTTLRSPKDSHPS